MNNSEICWTIETRLAKFIYIYIYIIYVYVIYIHTYIYIYIIYIYIYIIINGDKNLPNLCFWTLVDFAQ